jgi:hypothetical protein
MMLCGGVLSGGSNGSAGHVYCELIQQEDLSMCDCGGHPSSKSRTSQKHDGLSLLCVCFVFPPKCQNPDPTYNCAEMTRHFYIPHIFTFPIFLIKFLHSPYLYAKQSQN